MPFSKKRLSKNSFLDNLVGITTIITTNCRKNAPNIDILTENVKSLSKYTPILSKKLIIVFDGGNIQNDKLSKKCKDPCNLNNYDIYIKNIKKNIPKLLPNSNIKYLIMPERSCLSNSLKAGIQIAETEFINIMQEDLIINKPFDVINIINAIKNNEKIDIIRYSKESNMSHEVGWSWCYKGNLPSQENIQINNLLLSKASNYTDNNHISTKSFYNEYIFPNVNDFDFMEHQLGCPVNNKVPSTIWYLGNYDDGDYVIHLDGRK